MDLHEQKKRLRTELKKRRFKLPDDKQADMSRQIIHFLHQIDEFNQAKSLFCYISYLSEVQTPLL